MAVTRVLDENGVVVLVQAIKSQSDERYALKGEVPSGGSTVEALSNEDISSIIDEIYES